MLSGTQYMLQKNPCTQLPLLTFGILIALIVITELVLETLSGQRFSCKEVQITN